MFYPILRFAILGYYHLCMCVHMCVLSWTVPSFSETKFAIYGFLGIKLPCVKRNPVIFVHKCSFKWAHQICIHFIMKDYFLWSFSPRGQGKRLEFNTIPNIKHNMDHKYKHKSKNYKILGHNILDLRIGKNFTVMTQNH